MQSENDGFPDQCIIFDREYVKAPFYLRVKKEDGAEHVELSDANGQAQTLPAAVQICVRDGYDPTHIMEVGRGLSPIPSSIVRRPASSPRKG